MASDYDGLTVADLKEVLRERGLPVSGAKGVLIARLQDHDARSAAAAQPSEAPSDATEVYDAIQVKEGKVKFRCRVCGVLLAVPPGYKGKVECPACKTQQPVPKPSTFDERYPFDLTRNQWSMAVSITGVVIALVAIFIFFSAFSYDVMCPEEARGEIVQDGETYKTCDGGSWGPTLTRLFVSCFVLVPIAAALTQTGFALRKPKVSLQQPIQQAGAGTSTSGHVSVVQQQEQFSDSASAEVLQRVAKYVGVGLTAGSVLVALAAIAFVVFIIYLLFYWSY